MAETTEPATQGETMTTKKADTGKKPGNQTPNTPDVNETELRRQGWKSVNTGKLPGNQTPNTPGVNESEGKRR
jgi:hypothetical protein